MAEQLALFELPVDCRGRPVDPAVAARRARWQLLFPRAPWVAPHDTAGGMKAGESCPGWQCPVCGQVEPTGAILSLEHGWDPSVPGHRPWHGYCRQAVPSFAANLDEPYPAQWEGADG